MSQPWPKQNLDCGSTESGLDIKAIEKLLGGQPKGVKSLTSLLLRVFKDEKTAEEDTCPQQNWGLSITGFNTIFEVNS